MTAGTKKKDRKSNAGKGAGHPEEQKQESQVKAGSQHDGGVDKYVRNNSRPAGDDRKKGKSPADEKIADLEIKLKEQEDKYLRLRAEYDNHIRRTTREKLELAEYGGMEIIQSILPVLNDLKRTIDHAPEDNAKENDSIIQGVGLIVEKFAKILEAEGVTPIHAVGKAFDPELHDALMRQHSGEHPEGTVIEEFEPGYCYKDKVIRHAKVVVSG